jgi:hypothetical protein
LTGQQILIQKKYPFITSGEQIFCAKYSPVCHAAYPGQEANVKRLKMYLIEDFGWVNPPQNLIFPSLAVETDWIGQGLDWESIATRSKGKAGKMNSRHLE